MASLPPVGLPLLYKDLVPLSSVDHGDWKVRRNDTAPYAATEHAVPVTTDEFFQVQRHYPIVFTLGENPVPIALMALNAGMNTVIAEDGTMRREAYVPAYIRRYPFILARLQPQAEELSLCFDPTADAIAPDGDGDALFTEDGQPTEVTQFILKFCEDFETRAAHTAFFMNELKQADLLMDGEIKIEQTGNDKPFLYRGFQMINQDKFQNARGDQLRKWQQNGALSLIHAHFFSLSLLSEMFDRQVQMGKLPEMMIGADQ
ncbi:MAG: multidrug transporter [Sphingomonas sanxanigenens]|uniref:Multidrug transporter n=1 Tax=Sphingomonas sanxanigenens TaxID=397260 RepID=A0A2W5A948_9SPHN|nr:MAG: multidrug transporter [Sphingomonas sanxanigenens]